MLISLIFIITIILLLVVVIWYFPQLILKPVNALFKLDKVARPHFYSQSELLDLFPTSQLLQYHFETIKAECINIYNEHHGINYLDNYNVDLMTATTKEWSAIPLRVFGKNTEYQKKCPKLKEILDHHSEITSCLVSVMEPGKVILPHQGPYDGLLRYQLALVIPKDPNCYLHVNGEKRYWTEGEGMLFDETMSHGAVNDTPHKRIVLLIDILRPYHNPALQYLNKVLVKTMGFIS